jgi:2-succinyl-5-enolpyruvyl-6-hydroxy-3-cyclohexene-1-carboxylate synthase
LVDEWIRQGVRHAVIAPGSRSTPLAVQLSQRVEISVHVFHDERSASFAALGVGLHSGIPAVLLCTSGTAATHFHGAVAEADLSNVPMIVCTADRPPELRDVGAPQTIDQIKMYGSMVRWFHDPGVPNDEARHSWRSLAARSYAATLVERPGPVHLNLPFREPLLGSVGDVPSARSDAWSLSATGAMVPADALHTCAQHISGKTGVIVAGRGATASTLQLARALGWPVFADARSGLRNSGNGSLLAFDGFLRSQNFAQSHAPDVVIRIGEPPASKVTNQWIAASGARIVQIQPHANVTDPDHLASMHLIGDVTATLESLSKQVTAVSPDWLADFVAAENASQKVLNEWTSSHESEPTNARVLTKSLQQGSNLVVSSSMPIRDVEWFGAATDGVQVFSNRGANGIDGVTSTAIGVALSSRKPTVVYIGDVAALHDSNAMLSLMSKDVDVKIVVSNNDGGSIFSFLPQASQVDTQTFEQLYGTPHGVAFDKLAAAYGIPYAKASSSAEISDLVSATGTCLIELTMPRNVNVPLHSQLNDEIVRAVDSN